MDAINVLMLGGRRSGKSTLLASIIDNFYWLETVTDGNIRLFPSDDASPSPYLKNRAHRMFSCFEKAAADNAIVAFDYEPLCGLHSSEFCLTAPGIRERQIVFCDVPGEYLRISEHREFVQELLTKSHIIIISIDTPHMVEEIDPQLGYGKYHNCFNRVAEVTHLVKRTLQNKGEPCMVIFVPMKCEKYYHESNEDSRVLGMEMVNSLVKKGYSELIAFLCKETVRERCATAIMPVLTMGGIEFASFYNDAHPEESSYTGFYRFASEPALRKFHPQYCEQPLLLLMLYALVLSEHENDKNGILAWLNRKNIECLHHYERKLNRLMITDSACGFEILNSLYGTIA